MDFNHIDKRSFSSNKATKERMDKLNMAAEKVSEGLSGSHSIKIDKFDKTTGNFAEIISSAADVPQRDVERTNYVKRAEQYLTNISPAMGFERSQPPEFKFDQFPQVTSSNSKIVHARQTFQSIDIFQSGTSVQFDSNDSIKGVRGNVVTVSQDIIPPVALTVKEAVRIAAKTVGNPPPEGMTDSFGESVSFEAPDLNNFEPEINKVIREDPAMTTFLNPGPFAEPIKAKLIWFELKPGDLRLSWEIITTQKNSLQYRTIVDATRSKSNLNNETEAVLYNKLLTFTLLSRMNVYTLDGSKPRQFVDCPIPLTKYLVSASDQLPNQFPDHWNDDNVISTVGNSTYAHLGESSQVYDGTMQNNTLVFDPADPTGDDQKILNMFYFNCYMHDLFYILGFTEKDFNFQLNNFGRGGFEGDRVDSRAHSGGVIGTANMYTPSEGTSPVMNMGLVTRTGNHTCFDSSVVFHEFMHGVTNRIVGGGIITDALDSMQSGMMGEGWGDYIACTINKKDVVGDWVVSNPKGIRSHPYNSNYPKNFGDLPSIPEVHDGGEVWCATLLEMNRNISDDNLAMQLVVDALKISQPNPSFLNMRDAILTALDDKLNSGQIDMAKYKNTRSSIWKAFAKFGMGPNAQSNGAQLDGIVADFSEPHF